MTHSFTLITGKSIPEVTEDKNHLILKTLLNSKQSDERISITEVDIDGFHQSLETRSELRIYFVISGLLEFTVDGLTEIKMTPGDVLTLKKNCQYSLQGKAKYLVINTPAFKDGDDLYL